jgi:uncharacterized protein (DUF608 family)
MKSILSPRTALVAVAGLFLLGDGWNCIHCLRADEGPSSVKATVLDVPARAPDGSIRFHVHLDPSAAVHSKLPAAASQAEAAAALFEDNFDAGRKSQWHDVLGTSGSQSGKLHAASPRNDVVVSGIQQRDVSVGVDAEAAMQMGILLRYRDAKNFILAFYTPGARILGFHEVVDGNLGPWVRPVSTAGLSGQNLHMDAAVRGGVAKVAIRDEHGKTARTQAVMMRVTAPGTVGLYHDTSAPGTQRFDNFRVVRIAPLLGPDAVEVVVPASEGNENVVWSIGRRVRITGAVASAGAPGRIAMKVSGVKQIVPLVEGPADETLFPCGVPGKQWIGFPAQGFGPQPACGVVYRSGDEVTNGLPLGGIDTGCVDLETSGMLGYATIYNTHVPRRGPMNVPILGLGVGPKTWLLCDPQPKDGAGGYQPSAAGAKYTLWRNGKYEQTADMLTPVPMALNFDSLSTAREIHYWGHYPVADMEFQTDAPVRVGLRAWAPFLPGEVVDSMLPGAVFEVHLRNPGPNAQSGTIAFSFPGPLNKEAGAANFRRQAIEGDFRGVEVTAPLASWALGVIGDERPRVGGELGNDAAAWAKIARQLPAVGTAQSGASAAVDFRLAPGEVRVVRFAVTWCAPEWNAGGYNWAGAAHRFTHMYAKYYPSARQAAETLGKNHAALLHRILAWQQVIYAETSLPVWIRDSLVNNLHLITETGMWAQAKPPLPSWVRPEDGLFGMNECPRGCPQIECIPCSFYGNQPLVYFFPELARSTLRGYQGYQYSDGAPPWIFGGCTCGTPPIDFANPSRGYQWTSNGISGAAMVDRFLMCHDTPDGRLLKEFYPAVKKWMTWTVNLRTTPSYSVGERVIAMPNPDSKETATPPTEWFEAAFPGWAGMTAHVAGLHLAQLRITQRMAQKIGDRAYADQCEAWIKAGSEAMEKRLWDPQGYYLNYFEPVSGRKSPFVFGYQMDGEWITDHHGLPSALSAQRVKTVLETIKRCNIKLSSSGAVNYANPDASPYKPSQPGGWDYGTYSYFPPEVLMLAMNYMYEGQREFGLELARKVWHNMICVHGYTWDMTNIMRGDVDTGERTYGNDYYQDMMLWSLPAAIEGKDFAAPARPGRLVDRVIRASRAK